MTDIAVNLAQNIRHLREQRRLTQQRLADISDIPRPTWASLESGGANPTLTVLTKVACALQVSIEELVAQPRAQVEFFKAGFGKIKKRSGASLSALLPEVISGLEISRLELDKGAIFVGSAHITGTREYLTCERGSVELITAGNTWTLNTGDAIVFRGDQGHSYRNPDQQAPCVAISVVCIS